MHRTERLLMKMGLYPLADPSSKWLGVMASSSLVSSDTNVSGLEFIINSISQSALCRLSLVNFIAGQMADRTLFMEPIRRSHAPPI